MYVLKNRAALAIAAVSFAFVTGCTESESAAAAKSADVDSVGSVNGVPISRAVMDVYAPGRLRKPLEDVTDEERSQVLSELQDIYLLAELAKKAKVDKKPKVAAQLSLQRRSVLAQALVADYVESHPATDEELQAGYDEMAGSTSGEQYKARHILVRTEDEANEVIAQLKSGDTEFADLAKEKSTGPSGPQGGDLGWFSADSMVKPFADAVAALENGKMSDAPVETQFGWHVILREDSKPNTPPPFEEISAQLRPSIEQKKFQEYLEEQRTLARMESSL